MNILFLSDDFPPMSFGGAGISTFELAKGVKDAGHEVSVITTCRKADDAGEFEYEGLKVFRIASDYHERWRAWVSLYNLPVVREVKKILNKVQPDVVHANNIHFHLSYYCLKLAKKYGRVVWTARDSMSYSYGKTPSGKLTWLSNLKQAHRRWNPFRNSAIRRYLRYADKKFALSAALATALQENGIPDVEVLHTGIDVNEWVTEEGKVLQFKKKFDLENKKVILFGGRLSEGKGERQAREAIRMVREHEPDAVLLIMGKEDRGGEGIISTSWVEGEEKKAAYAAADVVWVPSIYLDPLPRVVLEAMASGKPVVGTKYGGTPEAVVDGVTGYVVDPLHPEEIAQKTLDLLHNPDKARAFGAAGIGRIEKSFNLADMVKSYIAVYLGTLELR